MRFSSLFFFDILSKRCALVRLVQAHTMHTLQMHAWIHPNPSMPPLYLYVASPQGMIAHAVAHARVSPAAATSTVCGAVLSHPSSSHSARSKLLSTPNSLHISARPAPPLTHNNNNKSDPETCHK